MYQQVIIVGNVGRAPELRYLQSGQAVCDFSVAVNETWTVKDTDEKKERTTWFKITCWRGLAETVNQYVYKGMLVMAVGTINASAWLKDGEPKASLELNAQTVRFLSKRDSDHQQESAPDKDPYAF